MPFDLLHKYTLWDVNVELPIHVTGAHHHYFCTCLAKLQTWKNMKNGDREKEREREIEAQTGVVTERERLGERERKIKTQTGVGERERVTGWERKKQRNTDRSGG